MRPASPAAALIQRCLTCLPTNCSAEGKRVNSTIRRVTSLIDVSQLSQNKCCTPTSLLLILESWEMNYLTQNWHRYPTITSPSPLHPQVFFSCHIILPAEQKWICWHTSHRSCLIAQHCRSKHAMSRVNILPACARTLWDMFPQQAINNNQSTISLSAQAAGAVDSNTAPKVLTPMILLSKEHREEHRHK